LRKLLVITVLLSLFAVSLIPPAFAQGAASGESIGAFQRGQAPVTPATKVPGIDTPRVSYWALAGLGRDPQALGTQPPAMLDAGMPYNPFSMYGPYGIYDQYGMYGPYGMFGPSGPGYGSGYGFNGFGLHDEWELVKVHNREVAQASAGR
jgi:hypothetical protein